MFDSVSVLFRLPDLLEFGGIRVEEMRDLYIFYI